MEDGFRGFLKSGLERKENKYSNQTSENRYINIKDEKVQVRGNFN